MGVVFWEGGYPYFWENLKSNDLIIFPDFSMYIFIFIFVSKTPSEGPNKTNYNVNIDTIQILLKLT